MSDKIKVLFLSANPKATEQLQIDEELRAIQAALRNKGREQSFEVAVEPALRPTELSTAILRETPDIIHYSGHGGTGELYLAADAENVAPLSAERLQKIFKIFADRKTSCVLLNACFSSIVSEPISEVIPCVIGMTAAIPDRGAIEFAAGFYLALATGGSVRQAFEQGKLQLATNAGASEDLPKLHAREGIPESIYFVGEKARPIPPRLPPPSINFGNMNAPRIEFKSLPNYTPRPSTRATYSLDVNQKQNFKSIEIVGQSDLRVKQTGASVGPSVNLAANITQVQDAETIKGDQGSRLSFDQKGIQTKNGSDNDAGAQSPVEQAKAALAALKESVAQEKTLLPTKKKAIALQADCILDYLNLDHIDAAKNELDVLRTMLASAPALLGKLDVVKAALDKL